VVEDELREVQAEHKQMIEVMDQSQSNGIYWGLSGKHSCRLSGRFSGYALAEAVANLTVAVVEAVGDIVTDSVSDAVWDAD